MRGIEANLLPDEQILYRTRKHYIIFFPPALLTLMTLIFLLNSNPFVVRVAFIPALAALVSWLNEWLDYITSEFAVTNKRIMMKEGFFTRHSNEARLTTITNISTTQSLIGQLLHFGTVIINTFGGMNDAFPEIPNPNEFQKQVQMQLDKLANPSSN